MKTMNIRTLRGSRRSRGFTLIELMVSVTIGLIVVLTLMAAFLGSGIGGRHTSALGQMTEDASLSLNIMRTQVAMAGYGSITGVAAGVATRTVTPDQGVFGCDNGFDDVTVNDYLTLTCKDAVGPDAMTVRYEADEWNAIAVASGPATVPTDCEGNAITPAGGVAISESRFFISNNQLMCRGNGAAGGSGTAMVGNVQDLAVTYGVASATAPDRVVTYVAATTIGETPPLNWDRVLSVRICVVVRSEREVNEFVSPYFDCAGTSVTPTDRRMYRAFTTTIVLPNRAKGIAAS